MNRGFLKKAGLVLLFIIVASGLLFVVVTSGLTIGSAYFILIKQGYSPALVITMLSGEILFGLFLTGWLVWYIRKKRNGKKGNAEDMVKDIQES